MPLFRRWMRGSSPPMTSKSEESLPSHRERNQTQRSHDDAPPRKQPEAVAGEIAEETLHHDDGDDERNHETDRDNAQMIGGHFGAVLVEIVNERADHGWDRQEERKLRRRPL